MSGADDPVHDFYVVGGAMHPDSPSYVERPADAEVLRHLSSGHLTYVLTTRQMGKSSLLARTLAALRARSTHTARVDLHLISASGKGVTGDSWFFGVAHSIALQLRVETGLDDWWDASHRLSSSQRFSMFLQVFVLDRLTGNIVVAIDEIDSTIGFEYADDFFAVLRACYNARASDTQWNRLTFMLLGAATPAQLIESKAITPFNIGSGVDLSDFTGDQAVRLASGFAADEALRIRLFHRVLHWTDGHPYLTQKVCDAIASAGHGVQSDAAVDAVVANLFFEPASRNDEPNLSFVSERILADLHRRSALQIYLDILRGTPVPDDPKDQVHATLRLSGLVKSHDGTLRVRNRIYERVFTTQWAWQAIVSDPTTFYATGGAMRLDAGSYVARPSDRQLRTAVTRGRHVAVLSQRMMGKTSALVRCASVAAASGAAMVIVDLSAGLSGERADVLPADIVRHWVARQLSHDGSPLAVNTGGALDVDLQEMLGPTRKAVIIVDELDGARDRLGSFLDQIAACLTSLPTVTWILSAAMSPLQWRMVATAPALSGFEILELVDFALQDAGGLAEPWDTDAATKSRLLARVFEWTGGHPYLTQRLCRAMLDEIEGAADAELVDRIATRTFLHDKSLHDEPSFHWPRAVVESSPERAAALRLYRRVRQGHTVRYEPASSVHDLLMRAGLVRAAGDGVLEPRNRLYREVFTDEWAANLLPASRYRPYAVGATAALVLMVVWYAVIVLPNRRLAELDDPRSSTRTATAAYQSLRWAFWADRDARFAAHWRRQAMRADRDSAILYQLRALQIDDTQDARRALAASIGEDYGSLLMTFRPPESAASTLSPDGLSVLTSEGGFGPASVRVWLASTGEPLTKRLPYPAAIERVMYSPDGTFFAAGGRANHCQLWNSDGKERARLPTGEECNDIAISPDSRLVATADGRGFFIMWDSLGKRLRELRIGSRLATTVQFSPDGSLLLGVSYEGGRVWQTATGAPVTPVLFPTDEINDAAFDPKGAWIVLAKGDGDVAYVDLKGARRSRPGVRHGWRATSVHVSPDGSLLATSGQDNTARVWSVESGEQRCAIALNDDPRSMEFMDASRRLMIGESDGRVSTWSLETCLAVPPSFREAGGVGAFPSGDGAQVLTRVVRGAVRLWSATPDEARRAAIERASAAALLEEWQRRLALQFDRDGNLVPR